MVLFFSMRIVGQQWQLQQLGRLSQPICLSDAILPLDQSNHHDRQKYDDLQDCRQLALVEHGIHRLQLLAFFQVTDHRGLELDRCTLPIDKSRNRQGFKANS